MNNGGGVNIPLYNFPLQLQLLSTWISTLIILFICLLCQCATGFAATVLPEQGGQFARPSPRSMYTYTSSGASPAQLATPCYSALRWRRREPVAHGILGYWGNSARTRRSLRGKARLFSRAALSVRGAILRRGIPLLVLLASAGASREPEPRRSPAFTSHTLRFCPDLPMWRFPSYSCALPA